mgnify:CR=1 FL=1
MTPYTGLLFFYILALALVPAVVLGLAGRSLREYVQLLQMAACPRNCGRGRGGSEKQRY